MCEYCSKFSDGELWYLKPEHYARQLYRRPDPNEKYVPEAISYRKVRTELFNNLFEAKAEGNDEAEKIVGQIDALYRDNEPCQIIPLKDCLDLVELSMPNATMACVCRKMTRATEERNADEYSCLGQGVGMLKTERWPERYRGGVHFLSAQETKDWLVKWDKEGMVHCIMVYGMEKGYPYVGGICNCDYPDCLPIRHRLDYGITHNLLKSHYVAISDYDKCNGCGICASRCQFGAIKMELTTGKANIDLQHCFGCGVCETGCKRNSIKLVRREEFAGLKEEW